MRHTSELERSFVPAVPSITHNVTIEYHLFGLSGTRGPGLVGLQSLPTRRENSETTILLLGGVVVGVTGGAFRMRGPTSPGVRILGWLNVMSRSRAPRVQGLRRRPNEGSAS